MVFGEALSWMGLVLLVLTVSPFGVFLHPGLESPGSDLSPLNDDPNPLQSIQHP